MSELNRLIAKLCPDGVEYRALGSCLVRTKGTKITAEQMQQLDKENAPVKIFAGGKTIAYFDYDDIPANDVQNNPSVIVKSRGSVEFEYYNKPFSHKNEFWAYHSKDKSIDIKYVYYTLKNNEAYFRGVATSMGSLPQISIPVTDKYKIPVPPLPIQLEIVRILDNFTELTARKKQYNYYWGELLTFGEEVPMVALGEVCRLVRGNGLQKKDFTKTGVGCIHYGQIYTFYGTYTDKTKSFVSPELAKTLRVVNKGDIIITNTSENVEDVCKSVAWLGENDIVTGGHATILKHEQNPKYIAYYTQTTMFHNEKRKYAGGTKVIDVSATNMAKIQIPLPSLNEQARVVDILDRFDTLTNDITSGLPAEIAARQKQYEFYRDRLLRFEGVGV